MTEPYCLLRLRLALAGCCSRGGVGCLRGDRRWAMMARLGVEPHKIYPGSVSPCTPHAQRRTGCDEQRRYGATLFGWRLASLWTPDATCPAMIRLLIMACYSFVVGVAALVGDNGHKTFSSTSGGMLFGSGSRVRLGYDGHKTYPSEGWGVELAARDRDKGYRYSKPYPSIFNSVCLVLLVGFFILSRAASKPHGSIYILVRLWVPLEAFLVFPLVGGLLALLAGGSLSSLVGCWFSLVAQFCAYCEVIR